MEKQKNLTNVKKEKESAAGEPQALPSSFKKFRQLPEIEAFYRFVYENDLRKEAKVIIGNILLKRKVDKVIAKSKARKTKKKTLN